MVHDRGWLLTHGAVGMLGEELGAPALPVPVVSPRGGRRAAFVLLLPGQFQMLSTVPTGPAQENSSAWISAGMGSHPGHLQHPHEARPERSQALRLYLPDPLLRQV